MTIIETKNKNQILEENKKSETYKDIFICFAKYAVNTTGINNKDI
jgi:hypothetical protein